MAKKKIKRLNREIENLENIIKKLNIQNSDLFEKLLDEQINFQHLKVAVKYDPFLPREAAEEMVNKELSDTIAKIIKNKIIFVETGERGTTDIILIGSIDIKVK